MHTTTAHWALTQLVKHAAHIAHACADGPPDVDDSAGSLIRDGNVQPLVHLHQQQGQQTHKITDTTPYVGPAQRCQLPGCVSVPTIHPTGFAIAPAAVGMLRLLWSAADTGAPQQQQALDQPCCACCACCLCQDGYQVIMWC